MEEANSPLGSRNETSNVKVEHHLSDVISTFSMICRPKRLRRNFRRSDPSYDQCVAMANTTTMHGKLDLYAVINAANVTITSVQYRFRN